MSLPPDSRSAGHGVHNPGRSGQDRGSGSCAFSVMEAWSGQVSYPNEAGHALRRYTTGLWGEVGLLLGCCGAGLRCALLRSGAAWAGLHCCGQVCWLGGVAYCGRVAIWAGGATVSRAFLTARADSQVSRRRQPRPFNPHVNPRYSECGQPRPRTEQGLTAEQRVSAVDQPRASSIRTPKLRRRPCHPELGCRRPRQGIRLTPMPP